MADETNQISKMYVTSNFVNDAQFACNTLYLFGAAFKCPYRVDDTAAARQCILEYTDGWINRSQYVVEDNPVSMRLIQCDYNTLDEWTGGYGIPTCIDVARKQAIVKIPYLTGMSRQWIGYLTYLCNDINLMYCTSYHDKVAFYFVIDDYINPSRRGTGEGDTSGKNDVTYLCFDLSAMNLAATLVPIYTDPDRGQSWGGYVCSHHHILTKYAIQANGCVDFGTETENLNMIDVGSVADVNRDVVNNYTSLTSNLCNGNDSRLLMTADGRYVVSSPDTCYASDYLTRCSCTCISTANACVYVPRECTGIDPETQQPITYNPYAGCNTSMAELHLHTSECLDFDNIIYFLDDEN